VIKNALSRAGTSKKVLLAALAVAALSTATAGVALADVSNGSTPAGVGARATYSVKDYGAKGDGKANDASAINKAITAANKAGGGIVQFPKGTYKVGATVHMLSGVTLQLDSGSTISATGSGYDKAESNPNDKYQDYGHSHFNNAVIRGDNVKNIGFVGSGTIDGAGKLVTGDSVGSGKADKLISLTRCDGLTVNGITLKSGGHFAMITNGCNNITSDHLTIRTANNRDGWNIISAQHVRISNADIAASDDALGFKSDFALGKHFQNGDVVVTDTKLSSGCCNALMFGSETCGDFTGYHFNNIQITKAGKSGIGLTSQDGGKFSDINYENITMSNTAAPVTLKVGTRKRCGDKPGVGDITNIHFKNITGTKAGGAWSPTIWGQPGHLVTNVTFDNVKLTLPGGHGAMDPTKVPSDNGNYNPRGIGTRPAYGWYLHNVSGITFTNSSVDVEKADKRPALIANAGNGVSLNGFSAESGGGAPFDIGFQDINGYCATNVGSAKVSATGSSKNC
jgi:polygalacturonase